MIVTHNHVSLEAKDLLVAQLGTGMLPLATEGFRDYVSYVIWEKWKVSLIFTMHQDQESQFSM